LEAISPDEELKQHDIIYIQGNPHDVEVFHKVIK